MRFNTLDGWLNWQQSLNPKSIELGLERVNCVFNKLGLGKIADRVITVAGTNGKGSTVAYYETWLKNAGYKVASYTSPHLIKYNERIKLNLKTVSDESLCQAFSAIDNARGKISLTYFEFGTLAALYLISQFKPDIAILEIGLGGRLDAVNIIDADLAHLTPIGLDHQDWLGNTLDLIAFEKAGILRHQSLVVCNMLNPSSSLTNELIRQDSRALLLSRDYRFTDQGDGYIQWSNGKRSVTLRPALVGRHQALNISGVVAGLSALGFLDDCTEQQIIDGFIGLNCPGRLQKIDTDLACQLWVDVAHNEDAAEAIADTISDLNVTGRVIVLLGMLSDKNPAAFVAKLTSVVDEWWVLGLNGDRGLSAKQLSDKIHDIVPVTEMFNTPQQSIEQAVLSLTNQDILLVCGSFITVEALLTQVTT